MASFSLLSVLGNGSGRTAGHHRFPIAAYQSGSILVLWDYVRSGGESRQYVLLQPNQRCTSLFFSHDSQHVLGLWLSQVGQPTLSVWQVTDGAKVAEQRLSDQSGGSSMWADFHSESSHLLVVYGGERTASVSVVCWNEQAARLRPVAHSLLGGCGALTGVRLLDEGHHFVTCEIGAVVFWAFLERVPRQALRVDLNKPVRAFEVHAGLMYLLPEKGRLQAMNFEGQQEHQLALSPPPGFCFTAIAVQGALVCLGLDDGGIQVYASSSAGELWRQIPFPADSHGIPAQPVVSVSFGMNGDYVCVAFADATHGVVHLDSGRYVALRVGHCSAVRSFVMGPDLQVPASLATSVLDSDSMALSRTVAFLTLSGDRSWVTWPRHGAPVRAALHQPVGPPLPGAGRDLALESYSPRRGGDTAGPPLVLSAAAFHPVARMQSGGDMAGAYLLLAGAADGSLHVLASQDSVTTSGSSRDMAWRTVRVRPAAHDGSTALRTSSRSPSACSHLDFSRCGQYVAASFQSGLSEMLVFQQLTRAVVLQSAHAVTENANMQALSHTGSNLGVGHESVHTKSLFVWRPEDPSRAYDKNIYLVSHTFTPRELALYEVYTFGDGWAKSSHAVFALPAVCQAAGGEITDFCAHPSQLYLVATAVLPAADTRSIALTFDMWSGELLNSCSLFSSLLAAPLLPLRPSLCIDASGSFLFCASTPTNIGPLGVWGQMDTEAEPSLGTVTDSMFAKSFGRTAVEDARGSEQTASVVCIVDFFTGLQTYQSSVEVSCLAIGSLTHDPTQLLLGAHDGSVSVWHPPEAVSSRIRGLLEESKTMAFAEKRRPGDVPGPSMTPAELEEAIALHWSSHASRLDWEHWGEDTQQAHGPVPPPSVPPEQFPRRDCAAEDEEVDDDIVVQARRRWPPPAPDPTSSRADDRRSWCPRPAVREAMKSWPPLESLLHSQPSERGGRGCPPAEAPVSVPGLPVPTRASSSTPRGKGWPPLESAHAAPSAPAWPPDPRAQKLTLDAMPVERDEVSGLEVRELPVGPDDDGLPLPGSAQPPRGLSSPRGALPTRPPEPAELLVAAPEFYEEFGTRHEHFGDPAPTPSEGARTPASGLKSGLGAGGRGSAVVGGGLRAARHLAVLKTVLSDIDRFETENPDSKALESPRSIVGGDDLVGGALDAEPGIA